MKQQLVYPPNLQDFGLIVSNHVVDSFHMHTWHDDCDISHPGSPGQIEPSLAHSITSQEPLTTIFLAASLPRVMTARRMRETCWQEAWCWQRAQFSTLTLPTLHQLIDRSPFSCWKGHAQWSTKFRVGSWILINRCGCVTKDQAYVRSFGVTVVKQRITAILNGVWKANKMAVREEQAWPWETQGNVGFGSYHIKRLFLM